MAADAPVALEAPVGCERVRQAGLRAAPGDPVAVLEQLERVAKASAVIVVHLAAALVAAHAADRRAGQYRYEPVVVVADRGADGPADDGAERGTGTVAIAAAAADAVVVGPVAAGVADIIRVVLRAPAMCRGMGGRVRDGGAGQDEARDERGHDGGAGAVELLHGVPPVARMGQSRAAPTERRVNGSSECVDPR